MEGQQVEPAAGDEGNGRRAQRPQPGGQGGHEPCIQRRQRYSQLVVQLFPGNQ